MKIPKNTIIYLVYIQNITPIITKCQVIDDTDNQIFATTNIQNIQNIQINPIADIHFFKDITPVFYSKSDAIKESIKLLTQLINNLKNDIIRAEYTKEELHAELNITPIQ